MWFNRPVLNQQQMVNRRDQANRRILSVGGVPAVNGVEGQLAPDLTRHGRDQLFGVDARFGDYVPERAPFPDSSLFQPLHRAIQHAHTYLSELPASIYQFFNWFRNYASHREWTEPVWNQQGDPNDVIFIAIHEAETLSNNLREVANQIEEDIQRLDHEKQTLEDRLPENYSSPWSIDPETGELFNNITGMGHNPNRPHFF